MTWLWLTIDRILKVLYQIKPVQSGGDGILGINIRRHLGPRIILSDGTQVNHGDRVLEIHLNSTWFQKRRDLKKLGNWDWEVIKAMSLDLITLANKIHGNKRLSTLPLHGVTFLAAGAERLGFQPMHLADNWNLKLQRFYQLKVMKCYYLNTRSKSKTVEKPLILRGIWLSSGEFFKKYPPTGSTPGQ